MPKKNLPSTGHTDQKRLREQIQTLQDELEEIQKETRIFEALLHSYISDLIVEEQELFVLYTQIKKAKKAKRLEQKKRGKKTIDFQMLGIGGSVKTQLTGPGS